MNISMILLILFAKISEGSFCLDRVAPHLWSKNNDDFHLLHPDCFSSLKLSFLPGVWMNFKGELTSKRPPISLLADKLIIMISSNNGRTTQKCIGKSNNHWLVMWKVSVCQYKGSHLLKKQTHLWSLSCCALLIVSLAKTIISRGSDQVYP